MSHLDDEKGALERAPFLFSELPCDVMNRIAEREQSHRDWTAARFFSERRDVYDVVVKLLGAQIPVRFIAEVCNVSEKTVAAVRAAEPGAVTAFRETMTKRRVAMLHRCADVIAAALEEGSSEAIGKAKDAAIVMNILDGQQRLDQGAPTSIVEVHQPPAVEKFRAWMDEVLDVQAEVMPQTGSERDERETKGEPGKTSSDSALEDDKQ